MSLTERLAGTSGKGEEPPAPTASRLVLRSTVVVAASLASTVGQIGGLFAAFVAFVDPERGGRALALSVGLFLLAYLAGTASDGLALSLQEDISDRAERRVWRRLLALPISFFGERSLRDVIGYANCVGMTRTLLGALGTETALGGLTAVVASVLLCLVDRRLGLVALGVATVLLATATVLSWRQQRHDLVVMESVDAAHATLYPALTGLEELTAYQAQGAIETAWERIFKQQKDADLRGLRYADAGESLLMSTQTIMLATLVPLALLWSNGLIAMGSVTMIALQLAAALGRVTGVLPAIFSMGLARQRLAPVFGSAPEQDDTPRVQASLTGQVELCRVGFSYTAGAQPILEDVSIVAEPGQMVAVVGPSGAGKSTLLRLVLAQLEPSRGVVLADGIRTDQWDHEHLRAQIGYVPQSGALLRGTIRDAVVGVLDAVDDAQVRDALDASGLGELLDSLPMGLDTRIADGESGFSGGQEQRLLLARALVRAPRVLLLDEATSALDEQTQDAVAASVAHLGMTRIVVAHRHSTIRLADRIYVLANGRVVEQGTYDELIAARGRFASLTRNLTSPDPHRFADSGAGTANRHLDRTLDQLSPHPTRIPRSSTMSRTQSIDTQPPAAAQPDEPSRVLRFKRSSTVTLLEGEGVFVSSERGARSRIHGRLISDLYPLLDGTFSRAQAEQRLREHGHVDPGVAIDRLLRSGHVVEADPGVDVRAAGYWEQCGLDGDRSVEAARADVGLVVIGEGLPEQIEQAAAEQGLSVETYADLAQLPDQPHRLTVVFTDDYERPELAVVNEWSLRTGASWLLAKPIGVRLWVGPNFTPGQTACYECIRVRLESKSLTESYLRQRGALDRTYVESVTGLPSTRRLGVDLALQSAATWLAGVVRMSSTGVDLARAGDVTTFDTVDLTSTRHHLDARPQCSSCGDPQLQARLIDAPVEIVARPKAQTTDGGHRALTPEQFVERYEKFVSDITGPVSHLVAMPLAVPGLYVYAAGQNFAMPMRSIADLKAGLRSASCGKGKSPAQAKASALGEAIERYSGVFHGDERRIVAPLSSFDAADVVHPNELHQYSDRQFTERARWNALPSHFHWVGDDIDPDQPVEWTPLWSLTNQRQKWVPTSVLYYNYSTTSSRYNGGANSNGCAAGASIEDAVLQGFMELIERDATAIWWYNRSRRRSIDLSSFGDPYVDHWQQQYAALGRTTWVLDITTDLGIPTVVAVSHRTDKPAQDILLALGSHFDVEIAIGRALSEMNQFLPAVIDMPADGSGTYAFTDPTQVHWWKTATVESEPYLVPDPDTAPATCADFVNHSRTDLADDVALAREIVEAAGMEMLVLDQTRPDIDLPVARVVVPGLRHFWPRYAPGRLFDVPVAMGLQHTPTAEADLNPIAMFL